MVSPSIFTMPLLTQDAVKIWPLRVKLTAVRREW
jgi:hypothetical protein